MINDITLKNCLEFAVKTEEIGSEFYHRLAKKFPDNKEVVDIFTQLGKDEVVHKNQFSKLLKEIPEEKGISYTPKKENM